MYVTGFVVMIIISMRLEWTVCVAGIEEAHIACRIFLVRPMENENERVE
jgi:hypothetical protein